MRSVHPFINFCCTRNPANSHKLQVWNRWLQFFHVRTCRSIRVALKTYEVCLRLLRDLALKQAVLMETLTLLNWLSFVQDWIFDNILYVKSDVLNLRCLNTATSMRLFLYTLVCLTLEHIDLWINVQYCILFNLSIVLFWLKLGLAGFFASSNTKFFDCSELMALLVWRVERLNSWICYYISLSTHRWCIHHVIWVPGVYLFTAWA